MKKLIIIMCVMVLALTFVSATELTCWRDAKQGTDIQLIQKCDNCTFVNLSSIIYPNGIEIIINKAMTKQGTNYNYTLPDNTQLGKLIYSVVGDKNGELKQQTFCINITPSGQSGINNIWLYIIAFALLYGLNLFGFFKRNIPMTILSGMGMIFFGIYLINNGMLIYRDNLTNYIAYITIGWGFISAAWAALEQLEVL